VGRGARAVKAHPLYIHTVLDSRLSQPGGPGACIYFSQEQDLSVIPPGTGFPFRRLLRLAELRWGYLQSQRPCLQVSSSARKAQKTQPLYCRGVFTATVAHQLSRRGPHREHRTSVSSCMHVAGVTCKRRLFTESLLSNGTVCHNIDTMPCPSLQFITDHAGTCGNASDLHSTGLPLESRQTVLTEVFHGFRQSLRTNGARGSLVGWGGWGTMLPAGRLLFRFPLRSLHFSIDLNLPGALWP
jgi:hypothetical protein